MPFTLPEQSEAAKPKFLERVRTILRTRHYSVRTEEAYLGWMRRFILFHGKRHPEEMGGAEVAGFLNHLGGERGVAAATQNQALNALLFLYEVVLERELGVVEGLQRVRRPPKLPVRDNEIRCHHVRLVRAPNHFGKIMERFRLRSISETADRCELGPMPSAISDR